MKCFELDIGHTLAGNDEAIDANDRVCIVRSIGLPDGDRTVDRLSRRGSVLLARAERSMVPPLVSPSLFEQWVVCIWSVCRLKGQGSTLL